MKPMLSNLIHVRFYHLFGPKLHLSAIQSILLFSKHNQPKIVTCINFYSVCFYFIL